MIRLIPMQQADFEEYLEKDIQEYAKEHVRVGDWEPSEALEKSRKEHEFLLPDGLVSKNQYLFTIADKESGSKVGIMWVSIEGSRAFIYDFEINETSRGQGYGKQALVALDEKLRSMNVKSVGLHVFEGNVAAQELYKKMGFEVTGTYMKKSLK